MKKSPRIVALLLSASILLSGCGNPALQEKEVPELLPGAKDSSQAESSSVVSSGLVESSAVSESSVSSENTQDAEAFFDESAKDKYVSYFKDHPIDPSNIGIRSVVDEAGVYMETTYNSNDGNIYIGIRGKVPDGNLVFELYAMDDGNAYAYASGLQDEATGEVLDQWFHCFLTAEEGGMVASTVTDVPSGEVSCEYSGTEKIDGITYDILKSEETDEFGNEITYYYVNRDSQRLEKMKQPNVSSADGYLMCDIFYDQPVNLPSACSESTDSDPDQFMMMLMASMLSIALGGQQFESEYNFEYSE